LPQAVASASYNAANEQLTFGGQTLTYDANGNLITDGTNTYTWNARNQLVAINGASVAANFSYDGLGRRQGKTINSASAQFLYDDVNPVQELTGSTVAANVLTGLGIDEYLMRTDSTGAGSFLHDALGSTVALTDVTGSVATTYTYEPFGATTIGGTPSGNPFGYTGRENDGTGLYYYRARYYQPGLQRFISGDPIGFASGDFNLYAYVRNSPTRFGDPRGLCLTGNPADSFPSQLPGPPSMGGRKDGTPPEPTPCRQRCWEEAKSELIYVCGGVGIGGGVASCALGCMYAYLAGGPAAYATCLAGCGAAVGGAVAGCAGIVTYRYYQCVQACP
jgi:RHS repeat-associated protein